MRFQLTSFLPPKIPVDEFIKLSGWAFDIEHHAENDTKPLTDSKENSPRVDAVIPPNPSDRFGIAFSAS
jgi:hypothetical protein